MFSTLGVSEEKYLCNSNTLHLFANKNLTCRKMTSNTITVKNNEEKRNPWKKFLYPSIVAASLIFGTLIFKVFVLNQQDSPDNKKELNEIPHSGSVYLDDLPNRVEYILIGGGAAALSASRTIRSRDTSAQILMLSEEPYYPYMKPPLSKELLLEENICNIKNLIFHQWDGAKRSLFFEPERFYLTCKKLKNSEIGGIAVACDRKVDSINPIKKIVKLRDGNEISYEKCLIATGSSPIILPLFDRLPEAVQNKITTYHTIHDYRTVNALFENGVESIVIYGSGLLSCELTWALAKKFSKNTNNLKIYQIVEKSNVLTDILPPYLCDFVKLKMMEQGVNVINKSEINDISMKGEKLQLKLSNGQEIDTDHLIVCLGATPNTNIAKASGLEIDANNGGFLVNAELKVRSHLFAAGDCVSYYDSVLGKRRVGRNYDFAIVSGRTAGENMTGSVKPMTHQAMFWTELSPDLSYEAVGVIDTELDTVGVFINDSSGLPSKHSSNSHDISKDSKGVVFYLNNDVIEGVLVWNLYNRIPLARRVLAQTVDQNNVLELAKLFDLYEEPSENDE